MKALNNSIEFKCTVALVIWQRVDARGLWVCNEESCNCFFWFPLKLKF